MQDRQSPLEIAIDGDEDKLLSLFVWAGKTRHPPNGGKLDRLRGKAPSSKASHKEAFEEWGKSWPSRRGLCICDYVWCAGTIASNENVAISSVVWLPFQKCQNLITLTLYHVFSCRKDLRPSTTRQTRAALPRWRRCCWRAKRKWMLAMRSFWRNNCLFVGAFAWIIQISLTYIITSIYAYSIYVGATWY